MTSGTPGGVNVWAGAWLTAMILAICVAAMVIASGFVPATTRYFPFLVSSACIGVAVIDILRRLVAHRRAGAGIAPPPGLGEINAAADAPAMRLLGYAAWFLGFVLGVWLIGLVTAAGLFVAAFLKREAGVRWWAAIAAGVAVIVLVTVAGNVLGLRWPRSLSDPLSAIW